jgi:uncharacterized zinc-type alcohol dehydrogenase-like protein
MTVKAYAAPSANKALEPFQITRRPMGDHDVDIQILYCGVCHSDIHQARNEWGGSIFPMVPGHEIVGKVIDHGSKVTRFKVGDAVGVGCMVNSCRHCPACEQDVEQYCDGTTYTYNSKEAETGNITYGGYSAQIVVNEDFVLRIPNNLPLDKAAPLLCAGITTYSPLIHWRAGHNTDLAVIGFGGLGHMAVKIAHAMGAKVSVISHSSTKKADAMAFGADHFYLGSDPSTYKTLHQKFDLMLNTNSSALEWDQYIDMLKLNGTLVLIGVPQAEVHARPSSLIDKRRSVAGSLIGGIAETQAMLDFCGKHGITPETETIPMQDINKAYERMLKSDVRYRFVIDMSTI